MAKGVEVEATGFNSGNDVLTALVSKSIDVAQVTYLHYITALDKGFDVVAVSGQDQRRLGMSLVCEAEPSA